MSTSSYWRLQGCRLVKVSRSVAAFTSLQISRTTSWSYIWCAHWPKSHGSPLLQMWCQGKLRRTDRQIRPIGLVVCCPPEGKSINRNSRTKLACTYFTTPHIFNDDSLKRFWEINTPGIRENGAHAMTREEKFALDKTRAFHLFMMGSVTKLPHLGKRIVQCFQTTMRWPTVVLETQRSDWFVKHRCEKIISGSLPPLLSPVICAWKKLYPAGC